VNGLAVELTGVTRRFRAHGREVSVLEGLDLAVADGESLALVGSSGAGKSTLLSLLAGLDRPSSGNVVVCGTDLGKARPSHLAAFRFQNIGIVFQQYHLIPTLTALENVMLPCAPWRVAYNPRQRAAELLELVGLTERTQHFPAQLSGGEQQRVCIARALINSPRLLLADEPTGNLDEDSARDVIALIRQITAENRQTLVVVTHDLDLAQTFPRVLRLRQGKL